MPAAINTSAAVALPVRSSGGAIARSPASAANVMTEPHVNVHISEDSDRSMAAEKAGGLPCTTRKTHPLCRFPDEANATRRPATIQKATMATAARMPSAGASTKMR